MARQNGLESNGLMIIPVIVDPDVTDTLNAYIFEQEPSQYDEEGKRSKSEQGR